uniref:Trafficking protein particle complex subunit 13 n=1 Tax=Acrobeloides nanus TaxID=290746 RepID=A0A914D0L3_9BILA
MTESRDQLLMLRVMRMAKPKFQEPICMSVDPGDPFSQPIQEAVSQLTGQESMEYVVGEFLMAPQTIDNIYLGETLTFYVAVLNESSQICTDVCLKADLQTQTQRILLPCKLQDANAQLVPKEFLGQIITHEIKEIGQHILVCSVTYKTAEGEKMFFRKFFKFSVSKPIDVRTKFYNAEDNLNNDVYLEAQIQNLCSNSMVLEKVTMEPSEFYICSEIKIPYSNEKNPEYVYLEPKAIRQYLFCLSPNTTEHSLNHYRGVSSIGKLDMCWRTSMGERGRLQTSPLQRMAPGYGDLRLTIEKIPATVKLGEQFVIGCKLHNCCERSLDLVLSLDSSLQPALVFCSVSGQHLGQVPPNKTVQFSLDLLPISSGLQYISGIRITDTFLRRTYEHDEVAQIFVAA